MKIRRARWIWVVVGISLAVNLLLLTAVLYLKVPAVHNALLPAYRVVRGLPHLPNTSSALTTTTGDGRSLPLAPGEISLSASDDKTVVTVYLAPPVSGTHYVIDLDSRKEIVLGEGESRFSWTLHDGGSYGRPNRADVYSAFDGGWDLSGQIELFRVSEEEGIEHLGAHRENGWVFVGRCTYALVNPLDNQWPQVRSEVETLSSLNRTERLKIAASLPEFSCEERQYGSTEQLIDSMGALLTRMCERGLRPISAVNRPLLYSLRPADAVERVQRGEIGLQCQGMRSLFTWVAVSTGWLSIDEIREVDAYRYEPIPGIDVNSHAILEIKRPEGGWFAFDPMAETVFVDDTGAYLSAEQIRCLRENKDLDRISVVEVTDFCVSGNVPFYRGARPAEWQGVDFTDRDPFNNNYWSYFNLLVIRALRLPD